MHCDYCQADRYSSDQYCPDCGHHHEEKMRILQCDEVSREFTQLNEDLPNAEIFTGVVIDTFRYERENRTSKAVTEIGLWWLTLDNGVDQRQLSIYSEDAVHDSINRGDVITVFRSSSWINSFEIKHQEARNRVTNPDLAEAVVVHDEKEQRVSESPYQHLEPKKGLDAGIDNLYLTGFLVGIGWGVAAYFDFSFAWEIWASIAGVIWLFFTVGSIREDSKRYEIGRSFYQSEVKYFEQIIQCDRHQLNATNLTRPRYDNDELCNQCQSRKNAQHAFCPTCGAQSVVPKAPKSSPSLPLQAGSQDLVGDVVASSNSIKSLIESNISPQLAIEPQSYTHEFGIGPAKEGVLEGEWVLGTVIVRELESNVKNWVERKYKTTTYSNGLGKEVERSRLISEKKHRSSEMDGYIVLSTSEGEEFSYIPTQNQLSSTNVGDVIAVGLTQVDIGKEQKHFQQTYYNVSQDLLWENECLSEYSRAGITGGLSIWSLLAAGGMALAGLPWLLSVIPVIFSIILWLRGYEAQRANRDQRMQFVEKMKNVRLTMERSRGEWLSWLG
ncbi:hypothetical protein [uncultured Vibrio sp.]|uniref:hypothetical protein n=1 Tax=uncultured Vibrio sp. TaxID=114054 RepID=UPI0025DACC34|nr:hypothetical protein [uncultured Vibrio sp.]